MIIECYESQLLISIISKQMNIAGKLITLILLVSTCSSTLFSVNANYKVSYEVTHDELAHIYYEQKLNEHGMNYIHAFANAEKSLLDQHRGVGFLEGYTTYKDIYAAYVNLNKFKINAASTKLKLQNYLNEQIEFIELMAENNPRDLYWQTVYAYLEQCRYTYRGFLQRLHEDSRLDLYIGFSQFYYLTSVGDFRELLPALNQAKVDKRDRNCNIYVRKTDNDIVVTHSTMNYYAYLLRIFKSYHFPTRNSNVGSQTISFSGRPGDFNSKDDFYIASSGLKILETSLFNYNKDNWKELNPQSVPCWIRATVASNLARNGQQWTAYFSKYNSGTHNNQWVIIDKAQVSTNKNVVIFLEQAFLLIKIHDMTARLNTNGFVASYNVAYDDQVSRKLGYEEYPFNYENDPSAMILKNYHQKMQTVDDMKKWLLTNEEEDVRVGIAPREDQYQQDPQPFGNIDLKIVSAETESNNFYWVISSPTTSNGRFPPFSWKQFPQMSHEGMPETYNFTWQKVPINFQMNTMKHLMEQ